jgi:Zn-dependent protease with chaperone function
VTRFAATYFDGRSAAACPVEVSVVPAGELLIRGSALELRYRLAEVRVAARVGNAPRSIYLPDGGKCETRDNDAVDRALAELRSSRGARWLHALESRLPLVAVALTATVLLVWASLEYGVPYAARKIAAALPHALDEQLGQGALEGLDGLVLEPTRVEPHVRQRLRAAFAGLVRTAQPAAEVRLKFRASPALGPNALALPSGIVVVTDELVALAASEQELLAVLAHELGHIEHRHAVRGALQSTITPVLLAIVTGDLASLTALSATLPTFLLQLRHSRAFEREADDYAGALLDRAGVPREHFAAILMRLSAAVGDDPDDGLARYFSTHPGLKERVERLQAGER